MIDYDKLTDEVIKRIPPIYVIREGSNDPPIAVKPGGKIILPPIRFEIHHPNGDVFYQEKPLGGTIAIKLVPKRGG